jgi:hypothetical protein
MMMSSLLVTKSSASMSHANQRWSNGRVSAMGEKARVWAWMYEAQMARKQGTAPVTKKRRATKRCQGKWWIASGSGSRVMTRQSSSMNGGAVGDRKEVFSLGK